jgi:hypothetical protein
MNDERKCEGCGAPAVTSDSEGIPLCQACFDALPEINEEDRKAWATAEANLTYPTCQAVGHCPRPTADAAPFHHFYWDSDRDTLRLDAIHNRGKGHEDPLSEYGAVICKTCQRRALVSNDADDFPEI